MKKFIKIVALVVCLTLVEPAITPSIGVETVEAATKKVKINITQKTISEGQSIKLKIVGTKKKVKWSSSNKKIATVTTKGVVKGIDGGNNKKSPARWQRERNSSPTASIPELSRRSYIRSRHTGYGVADGSRASVFTILPAPARFTWSAEYRRLSALSCSDRV